MVMVDRLIRAEGTETVTAFMVRPDNVFVEDGKMKEPGLIENMAQTAAAGAGAGQPDAEPRTGFIGSIRNLLISDLPEVGSEIITRVTVEHAVMNASVVQAEAKLGENVVASCEMKIFLM